MYKLLLGMCYLRTRYLAFVCIVSVMLGVATLIVVNSVMSGFSYKLKDRLHGILSDVSVSTDRADGFPKPTAQLESDIASSPMGSKIAAMSPTVETVAFVQFNLYDRFGEKIPVTKQVKIVGIDPIKQSRVGGFSEYLVRQKNSPSPNFDLTEEGRRRFHSNLIRDAEDPFLPRPQPAVPNPALQTGGFLEMPKLQPKEENFPKPNVPPPAVAVAPEARLPGIILGYSLAHYRKPVKTKAELEKAKSKGIVEPESEEKDQQVVFPGDQIFIATISASGTKPVSGMFVVVDFLKTEMSEYDSSFVYVPVEDLQRIRGMGDHVNNVQIRLTDDIRNDSKRVHSEFVPELQSLMPMPDSRVQSWEQQQGPLLAAIDIERGILNILLFLIVGVAGFSVLAIFSMIVSEKYRDIGVMKSLGASNRGVMGIFIFYGMMLGNIGCIFGTIAGLTFTHYINDIEVWLARQTGTQIFDRSIYYFDKIPTNIEVSNVILINVGATATAVIFSLLPALRAARLQPVRALRFE